MLEELKDRVFYSMEELNRKVRRIVNELNSRKKTGEPYSRQDAFASFDNPKMHLCPTAASLCVIIVILERPPITTTCTTMSITIPCLTPCMVSLLS